MDLVLIAASLNLNLCIYYIQEATLQNQTLNVCAATGGVKEIHIYLGHEGYDIVYNKESMRLAEMCQSILLDVLDSVFGNGNEIKISIYKNIEFQRRKIEHNNECGSKKKGVPKVIKTFTSKQKDSSPLKKQPKLPTKTQEEAFAAYLEAYKRIIVSTEQKPTHTNAHFITYPGYSPAYTYTMQCPFFIPPPNDRLTGRIKFFDKDQSYGFFVVDSDGTDLFVHQDEFLRAGITLDYIQAAKLISTRFSFQKVAYYGKYNLSYKAINIQVLQ